MMQLTFNSISENKPNAKWQKLFQTHWSAYKAWYLSKGADQSPDLNTSVKNLENYMPKMMPTYKALCKLAGDDKVAHRFLTGWSPPAYISGCSQAVWEGGPLLVRNYDYHPNLCEGTVMLSQWHDQKVLGVGDCLTGLVDGVNGSGLVVSLTFGGSKATGEGFGIPFIIRYVLEFSYNLDEAVDMLCNIPCNMAYNVIVLDKKGNFSRVQLSPNRPVVVSKVPISTNHQGFGDWPEHEAFSNTVEREKHLFKILAKEGQNAEGLIDSFSVVPMFNTKYSDGFGTIYTAIYHAVEKNLELRWAGKKLQQSISNFTEGSITISYDKAAQGYDYQQSATAGEYTIPKYDGVDANYMPSGDIAAYVTKIIIEYAGMTGTERAIDILGKLETVQKEKGEIAWEILADMWSGKNYAKDYEPELAKEEI